MDVFEYLIIKAQNGDNWNPVFGKSSNFKNWIAHLDIKTCADCRDYHGKIWLIGETPEEEPPLHPNCRCAILIMDTINAGTATINGLDGADWHLKYYSVLPDYYLSRNDAEKAGYLSNLGNLKDVCPNKMIFGGIYKNVNGHLPVKKNRVWYEADINYQGGYRNTQRILWSNDGLIFVTFNHYKTFFEIV